MLDDDARRGGIVHSDTSSTLAKFPSWKVTPIPATKSTPSALMSLGNYAVDITEEELEVPQKRLSIHDRNRPVKARPISHPSIPQQFQRAYSEQPGSFREDQSILEDAVPESPEEWNGLRASSPLSLDEASMATDPSSSSPPLRPPNRKRFSMPALAVQTTSVTTRPAVSGEGSAKRFSLLLSGNGKARRSMDVSQLQTEPPIHDGFGNGVAVARLAKLLQRTNVE